MQTYLLVLSCLTAGSSPVASHGPPMGGGFSEHSFSVLALLLYPLSGDVL